MAKMKDRVGQLRTTLSGMSTNDSLRAVSSIPAEDSVNRQGYAAYSLDDELRLVSMLNVCKLNGNQFYRTENDTIKELRELVEKVGQKDPLFLAQAIIYSRCIRDGMRAVNHLAATLAAPFIAGNEWAKRFYGLWNKKLQKGGCVYRADDMNEMKTIFETLNPDITKAGKHKSLSIPNAMKKGFASALEAMDTYTLAKYKEQGRLVDLINAVHPNVANSNAYIEVNGKKVKTISAMMQGITVTADTWEAANSEAGQEVAKAVKAGKITSDEADAMLTAAKNDNWRGLLMDGKLGYLAALRNIRNILKGDDAEVITRLCTLLKNGEVIRKAKIMPYQIDIAYETVRSEFLRHSGVHQVLNALQSGYVAAIPNLAEALQGRTCVMVDVSGSMDTRCYTSNRSCIAGTAAEKAGLMAATILKACKGRADVICFDDRATMFKGNTSMNVFDLGKEINHTKPGYGGTSIPAPFALITDNHLKYDRIILLSDNECNSPWRGSWVSTAYKDYVKYVADPYVFTVDFCAYGSKPLANEDKVFFTFGYGYSVFDEIASKEFNPNEHMDKIRAIVI